MAHLRPILCVLQNFVLDVKPRLHLFVELARRSALQKVLHAQNKRADFL